MKKQLGELFDLIGVAEKLAAHTVSSVDEERFRPGAMMSYAVAMLYEAAAMMDSDSKAGLLVKAQGFYELAGSPEYGEFVATAARRAFGLDPRLDRQATFTLGELVTETMYMREIVRLLQVVGLKLETRHHNQPLNPPSRVKPALVVLILHNGKHIATMRINTHPAEVNNMIALLDYGARAATHNIEISNTVLNASEILTILGV